MLFFPQTSNTLLNCNLWYLLSPGYCILHNCYGNSIYVCTSPRLEDECQGNAFKKATAISKSYIWRISRIQKYNSCNLRCFSSWNELSWCYSCDSGNTTLLALLLELCGVIRSYLIEVIKILYPFCIHELLTGIFLQ